MQLIVLQPDQQVACLHRLAASGGQVDDVAVPGGEYPATDDGHQAPFAGHAIVPRHEHQRQDDCHECSQHGGSLRQPAAFEAGLPVSQELPHRQQENPLARLGISQRQTDMLSDPIQPFVKVGSQRTLGDLLHDDPADRSRLQKGVLLELGFVLRLLIPGFRTKHRQDDNDPRSAFEQVFGQKRLELRRKFLRVAGEAQFFSRGEHLFGQLREQSDGIRAGTHRLLSAHGLNLDPWTKFFCDGNPVGPQQPAAFIGGDDGHLGHFFTSVQSQDPLVVVQRGRRRSRRRCRRLLCSDHWRGARFKLDTGHWLGP